VELDGVDLSTLSLSEVRAAIRVVSQDATLFTGSVRDNLVGSAHFGNAAAEAAAPGVENGDKGDGAARAETASRQEDAEAWAALRAVGLAEKIAALSGGLDSPVRAGGAPFSAGERQLLAMARALVPRAPRAPGGGAGGGRCALLLADEPTASVDLGADEKLHDLLLGLERTTLVMICHRLQHVPLFDLVATVSQGRVVEVGPPQRLLGDSESHFSRLAARAGLRSSPGVGDGGDFPYGGLV